MYFCMYVFTWTTERGATSPPGSKAHAQSLCLLSLLALQVLKLLLLQLSVDLQLFVSQTHRGHAEKNRTSDDEEQYFVTGEQLDPDILEEARMNRRSALTWTPRLVSWPPPPAPLSASQPLGPVSPPQRSSCCSPSGLRGLSLPRAASERQDAHRLADSRAGRWCCSHQCKNI